MGKETTTRTKEKIVLQRINYPFGTKFPKHPNNKVDRSEGHESLIIILWDGSLFPYLLSLVGRELWLASQRKYQINYHTYIFLTLLFNGEKKMLTNSKFDEKINKI